MQSLNNILRETSLDVPEVHLDHFQGRVLEELYLEFFFARCRVLITPSYQHITTGIADPEEIAQLESILAQQQDLIGQLKRYLMYGLTLYSALLEANSYHIAVNDHLLIARFVGLRDAFEVKLYTLRPDDLPTRYADKIYLGRDVLRLDRLDRDHFGLGDIRRVLHEQTEKLRRRLEEHAPDGLRAQLERDYLGDLRELVEADALLGEMEKALFEDAPRAARYVTKLRKDVSNSEIYILLKVNGRITDAVNGIRL